MRKREYSGRELRRITGIDKPLFDSWIAKDVLRASIQKGTGRSNPGQFSDRDVIEAKLVCFLRAFNLDLDGIKTCLSAVRDIPDLETMDKSTYLIWDRVHKPKIESLRSYAEREERTGNMPVVIAVQIGTLAQLVSEIERAEVERDALRFQNFNAWQRYQETPHEPEGTN